MGALGDSEIHFASYSGESFAAKSRTLPLLTDSRRLSSRAEARKLFEWDAILVSLFARLELELASKGRRL